MCNFCNGGSECLGQRAGYFKNDTNCCLLNETCQNLNKVCLAPRYTTCECVGEKKMDVPRCLNSTNYYQNSSYPAQIMHRNRYDSLQTRNNSNQIKTHLTWNNPGDGEIRPTSITKHFENQPESRPKNPPRSTKNTHVPNSSRPNLKKVLVSDKKYRQNDNTKKKNVTNNSNRRCVDKCYCNNDRSSECVICGNISKESVYSDRLLQFSQISQDYESMKGKFDDIVKSDCNMLSKESLQDPLADYNDNPLPVMDAESLKNIRDFRNENFFDCHCSSTMLNREVNILNEPHKKCQHEFYFNDDDIAVPVNTDHENNSRCCLCYLPLQTHSKKKRFNDEDVYRSGSSKKCSCKKLMTTRKFVRHVVHSDCSLSTSSDDGLNEPEMFIKIPVTEDMLVKDKKYDLKNYRGTKMRAFRIMTCDCSCSTKK